MPLSASYNCRAESFRGEQRRTRRRESQNSGRPVASQGGSQPSEFLQALRNFPQSVGDGFRNAKNSVSVGFSLSRHTGERLLVASALNLSSDAPPWAKSASSAALAASSTQLALQVFYNGERERLDADMSFYIDGFSLLARDLTRGAPLVLQPEQALSPRSAALRASAKADMVSLVPFALLVMNTFPITLTVLKPILEKVPRKYVMPSSFEERRLVPMRRLRQQQQRQQQRQQQADRASRPLPAAAEARDGRLGAIETGDGVAGYEGAEGVTPAEPLR